MPSLPNERPRNPRGQGERLREELIAAARRVLERAGVEEAVTLRATAREAGVTAPAIYAHFEGREQIVEAVIATAFDEFATAVAGDARAIEDPLARLRAGCRAYLRYGRDHPESYRILFSRPRPSALPSVAAAAADVFTTLVEAIAGCVRTGRSASDDPRGDATALWVALHGLTSLPPSHPRFPWPDEQQTLDSLVDRLARILPPQSDRSRRSSKSGGV